ncbi:MAG: hypothetical protein ACOXZ4_00450 [Sphaerochaetaceae bacterium]
MLQEQRKAGPLEMDDILFEKWRNKRSQSNEIEKAYIFNPKDLAVVKKQEDGRYVFLKWIINKICPSQEDRVNIFHYIDDLSFVVSEVDEMLEMEALLKSTSKAIECTGNDMARYKS